MQRPPAGARSTLRCGRRREPCWRSSIPQRRPGGMHRPALSLSPPSLAHAAVLLPPQCNTFRVKRGTGDVAAALERGRLQTDAEFLVREGASPSRLLTPHYLLCCALRLHLAPAGRTRPVPRARAAEGARVQAPECVSAVPASPRRCLCTLATSRRPLSLRGASLTFSTPSDPSAATWRSFRRLSRPRARLTASSVRWGAPACLREREGSSRETRDLPQEPSFHLRHVSSSGDAPPSSLPLQAWRRRFGWSRSTQRGSRSPRGSSSSGTTDSRASSAPRPSLPSAAGQSSPRTRLWTCPSGHLFRTTSGAWRLRTLRSAAPGQRRWRRSRPRRSARRAARPRPSASTPSRPRPGTTTRSAPASPCCSRSLETGSWRSRGRCGCSPLRSSSSGASPSPATPASCSRPCTSSPSPPTQPRAPSGRPSPLQRPCLAGTPSCRTLCSPSFPWRCSTRGSSLRGS